MTGYEMMRKYKFKGKRIDNGEWVYGNLINCGSGGVFIFPGNNFLACETNKTDGSRALELTLTEVDPEVDPNTVGQFTGLKDENGTEIYEGDILRLLSSECSGMKNTVVVEYESGSVGGSRDDGYGHLPFHDSIWGLGGVIVGNIHDIPTWKVEKTKASGYEPTYHICRCKDNRKDYLECEFGDNKGLADTIAKALNEMEKSIPQESKI